MQSLLFNVAHSAKSSVLTNTAVLDDALKMD